MKSKINTLTFSQGKSQIWKVYCLTFRLGSLSSIDYLLTGKSSLKFIIIFNNSYLYEKSYVKMDKTYMEDE